MMLYVVDCSFTLYFYIMSVLFLFWIFLSVESCECVI